MFQPITFYVGEKTLGIYGEEFPLGALTTEVLNITPEEYQALDSRLQYFANARRKAGWKLELISQALGHRNIETTMRYLNISDQELMDVSDEFYRKHQSIYEIDKLL